MAAIREQENLAGELGLCPGARLLTQHERTIAKNFDHSFLFRNPNSYENAVRVLVVIGAMDYWADVDAVTWFGRKVFPAVRFYIVRSKPTNAVKALEGIRSGESVDGSVSDNPVQLSGTSCSDF